jgi:hypothetical protein
VIKPAGHSEIRVQDPADNQEYRYRPVSGKDSDWSSWMKPWRTDQENPVCFLTFSDLKPATAYVAQARYAENDVHQASEPSALSKPAVTDREPGGAAQKPVLTGRTSSSLQVRTHPGEEYSINGGTTWQTGGTFAGLRASREYSIIARKAETPTAYAGPASEPLKATTAPSSSGGSSPTPSSADPEPDDETGAETEQPIEPDPIATMISLQEESLVLFWTGTEGADGYDIFFRKCEDDRHDLRQDPGDMHLPATDLRFGTEEDAFRRALIQTDLTPEESLGCTMRVSPSVRCLIITGLEKETAYSAYVRAWADTEYGKVYQRSSSPTVYCMTLGEDGSIPNPAGLELSETAVTMYPGTTAAIRAKVEGNASGELLRHTDTLRYYSDNPGVAEVSQTGEIRATGEGRCLIYVLTCNGIWQSVQVTVKHAE